MASETRDSSLVRLPQSQPRPEYKLAVVKTSSNPVYAGNAAVSHILAAKELLAIAADKTPSPSPEGRVDG
jgi:hypothetical protein